jgi:transposase
VAHGPTAESTTHIETWEILRRIVGSAYFLYIADSKLCSRPNLKHIDQNHGRFLTVLPRSRKEDALFKEWLQHNTPAWVEVARKPHPRWKDGPPDIFRACPSPIPDADGFRLLWYESSHKMERDAQARRDAIQSASKALEALAARLEGPRPRFRAQAAVAGAVERILAETAVDRWLACEVISCGQASFQQEKPGRPGKDTRWRRQIKPRFRLRWTLRQEMIDYDARCDGIFPLLTNDNKLTLLEVLDAYKSKQPFLEKRHDLLKNVQAATPMYLKTISRIEALLFVHFIALLVHALIERQVRGAMAARGITKLPLYPEARACKAPSTDRILEILSPLQRHLLRKEDHVVQRFDPHPDEMQRKILSLLGSSPEAFMGL